jgi:transcriptional regulator GlxA family with amidase domain
MTKVVVLELPGRMASSAAITHDVLETANRVSAAAGRPPPFSVTTLPCIGERTRSIPHAAELVIVPGLGVDTADRLVDRLAAPDCRRASKLLAKASRAGASIAASCASTFLLAEAGLLDGRRATTTWWFAPLFRRRYPTVTLLADQIVVADWPVATGGAAMAQMDLMLAVVAKFAGSGLARACADYLLLDDRRSQAPFMAITYLAGQHPKVAKAESWVRRNVSRDFGVGELAQAMALTPRTFARRVFATCGLSPIQFIRRIRIETARFLLQTTKLPVEEIARQVGYADSSTLRRLMKRDTRLSPAEFRRSA